MTQSPPPSPIDWEKIDFPSGKISIKTLCRVEHLFADTDCGGDRTFWTFALNDLLACERQVAVDALAARRGPATRLTRDERQSLLVSLDQRYREFGLSDGPATTGELVRRLEASAVAQARGATGFSR